MHATNTLTNAECKSVFSRPRQKTTKPRASSRSPLVKLSSRSGTMNIGRVATLLLSLALTPLHAEPAAPLPLLNPASASAENRAVPNCDQVTLTRDTTAVAPALRMTIQPGTEKYPGITLKPESGAVWDLTSYGYVEAKVVNIGEAPSTVSLRLDNQGEWPNRATNAESLTLKPGASGIVKVYFGYSYRKPSPLKPEAIAQLLLFAGKSEVTQTLRIESLTAAGVAGEKPTVDPRTIRVKPKDGLLFGSGVTIDPAKQIEARGGAQAALISTPTTALKLTFPKASTTAAITFKPELGCWDLRDSLEIAVVLRNDSPKPVTPQLRAESRTGPTDLITAPSPIPPGATQEIVIPYISAQIWNGEKTRGNLLTNDAVSGVTISTLPSEEPVTLAVESIKARVPAAPALPKWLGQRPPVEGDWVRTFNDDFNGTSIDLTKWNVTGPNYWDKKSHWTPGNVTVSDGLVHMRYEKKTGFHNDNPSEKKTDYAGGYLDTYGKWVQRYGYFEARFKLPQAPGLWPAFWLMPDRGVELKDQSKRQDTANGGMEFDIFEHLTRWGNYRTNIAMHWDGYGKEHQAVGSERIYFQPDKEGFITSGLLWTPGVAAYYINGREVLRLENPRIASVPVDLMFTVPTGGWDNDPLDDAQLPAEWVIDYVRVWQRQDLASPVDGPKGKPSP